MNMKQRESVEYEVVFLLDHGDIHFALMIHFMVFLVAKLICGLEFLF